MKKILTSLLFLLAIKSTASHLMGGEIQMRHLEQFKYQIRVILYLDLNGENVHAEDSISASIFRNADNTLVEKFDLWHISTNRISSRYPICAVSKFAAMEVIYEQVVELDPADYSDPAGYYIAWQRCCRNYFLANIYSKDPGNNPNSPDASGVTFYLQFPPVSIDGNPFVNSSPEFSTALSNIACVSRDYYEIIHATDEDGDSLVYSIVAPLATQSTESIPEPAPKPYPAVKWKTLYNELNPLGGASILTISQDGVFRTTAGTVAGLHVYAIKCEEYRNDVKIGETIRQFEILVYDCPVFYRPELSFPDNESDQINLTLEDAIPDSSECFTISVFDQDATSHPEEIILTIAPNKAGITTEKARWFLNSLLNRRITRLCP